MPLNLSGEHCEFGTFSNITPIYMGFWREDRVLAVQQCIGLNRVSIGTKEQWGGNIYGYLGFLTACRWLLMTLLGEFIKAILITAMPVSSTPNHWAGVHTTLTVSGWWWCIGENDSICLFHAAFSSVSDEKCGLQITASAQSCRGTEGRCRPVLLHSLCKGTGMWRGNQPWR